MSRKKKKYSILQETENIKKELEQTIRNEFERLDFNHNAFSVNQVMNGFNEVLNNPYWLNNLLKMQDTQPRKYKRETIIEWLQSPADNENALRGLSQYFMISSEHYQRLVDYFSKILTFDYITIPTNATPEDMSTTKYKQQYKKANAFLDDFNVKDQFIKIMRTVISEGVYFGFRRTDGKKFTIQKMPTNWCKLVGRNIDGSYRYAFDLTYFLQAGINLDDYPPEFKVYMDDFKKKGITNTATYWEILPSDKAYVFKFDETISSLLPPLMGLFLDILEISDYKELIKTMARMETLMMLFQKIPMRTDKDAKIGHLLLEPNDAKIYHDNIKTNLPNGVNVITSPMEVSAVKFEKSQNKDSIVGVAESQLFSNAGVAPTLFGTNITNSIGIDRSIETDESFVIHMYRQFERFLGKELSKVTNKFKFEVWFPDITRHNYKDKISQYQGSAQYGYSKTLYACAMGYTPSRFENIMAHEKAMNYSEMLEPLQSSHTQSGTNNEVGRPELPENELSDAGVKTKDNQTNDNRR